MNKLKLSLIVPDPEQPRTIFKGPEMVELKSSIETQGILTPLIVESNYKGGKYLLLDGERRYRCAKELELDEVPVIIVEGPLSYVERTIKRFHIQEQHHNWSDLDKAQAIFKYRKESDKTITEIAKDLNLQIPKVHAYISVTEFTDEGQKLIIENNIEFTYLLFLIRIVKHYLSFTDCSQEEIEKKMVDKISAGVFKTIGEIQRFSKIMKYDGQNEVKLKFLNDPDYSFEDFVNETKLNEKEVLHDIHTCLEKLNKMIDNVNSLGYKLEAEHTDILKLIYNKIKSIK